MLVDLGNLVSIRYGPLVAVLTTRLYGYAHRCFAVGGEFTDLGSDESAIPNRVK
jgi:hypothetical protein